MGCHATALCRRSLSLLVTAGTVGPAEGQGCRGSDGRGRDALPVHASPHPSLALSRSPAGLSGVPAGRQGDGGVTGEREAERCLEQRRCSGQPQGEVSWTLDVAALLPRNVGSVEVRYQRGEGPAITCLGVSAVLRVVRLSDGSASDSSEDEALLHPSLTLQRCISCTRLIRFTIANFAAHGLRRGIFFQPDPYVKLRILPGESQTLLPHHGQEARSCVAENTVNPAWKRQEFTFIGYLHDVLEIELKDKFAKSRPIISRFLGRLTLEVATLRERLKSGSSGQLDFALGSKSTGESVSGHVYFSVTFTFPAAAAAAAACTGHGGLECPGELDRMRLKGEAFVDSHGDQELITNGHVGFRKNPLKSNNNSSSASSMSNGMGSSFGEEEIALNGEAGLGEARLDNGQDYTSSSSRESDYSPIWKYSCKVPNVTSKGKATESRGEEAIYETVYPAEDYQTQEGEATEAGPVPPHSDEDSPPPLPPRTKSLMKSWPSRATGLWPGPWPCSWARHPPSPRWSENDRCRLQTLLEATK
ncbi:E3 ubiquitin-protein ligase HECW1 [Chionoecetes opilio]|uniref:E3 ubiquitin-protein ligase HECW1 n=1 Tax=Chionoecetes opilio TaxID=41210 RepID=A0A8J4YL32_CHIOP|nr:E3 ubiquitin-protein ligase HECW1 [Chionoecetes opilio]